MSKLDAHIGPLTAGEKVMVIAHVTGVGKDGWVRVKIPHFDRGARRDKVIAGYKTRGMDVPADAVFRMEQ